MRPTYNLSEYLNSVDIIALELQQAILFLALGAAILLSGGDIVQDNVYHNPSIGNAVIIGFVQFLFGLLYFLSIHFKKHHLCMVFSWLAALIWFGFTGFYLSNDNHRIGAITCLILGCTNAICCYSCNRKR